MKNSFGVILLIFLMSACNQSRIAKQTVLDLPNNGWAKNREIKLNFKPEKGQSYDLYFLLRNDTQYPYSNIFLIADISNKQQQIIDTLEYEMADAQGKWLGSGFGEMKESKLLYKKDFQFKDTSNYTISVQQAVRKTGNIKGDSILTGIKTVGIIIEEANHK